MKNILQIPQPMKRRLLLFLLLCGFFLITGVAALLMAGDRTLLYLSLALCCMSAGRALELYRIAVSGAYETVEGACAGISPKRFRKCKRVAILDADGNLFAVLLDKRVRVQTGRHYRFYFKKPQDPPVGDSPQGSLLNDRFLGMEELDRNEIPEG